MSSRLYSKINKGTKELLFKDELGYIIKSDSQLFAIKIDDYSIIFLEDLEKLKLLFKSFKTLEGYTNLEMIGNKNLYQLNQLDINAMEFYNSFYVFLVQNRKLKNNNIELTNILIICCVSKNISK